MKIAFNKTNLVKLDITNRSKKFIIIQILRLTTILSKFITNNKKITNKKVK